MMLFILLLPFLCNAVDNIPAEANFFKDCLEHVSDFEKLKQCDFRVKSKAYLNKLDVCSLLLKSAVDGFHAKHAISKKSSDLFKSAVEFSLLNDDRQIELAIFLLPSIIAYNKQIYPLLQKSWKDLGFSQQAMFKNTWEQGLEDHQSNYIQELKSNTTLSNHEIKSLKKFAKYCYILNWYHALANSILHHEIFKTLNS